MVSSAFPGFIAVIVGAPATLEAIAEKLAKSMSSTPARIVPAAGSKTYNGD